MCEKMRRLLAALLMLALLMGSIPVSAEDLYSDGEQAMEVVMEPLPDEGFTSVEENAEDEAVLQPAEAPGADELAEEELCVLSELTIVPMEAAAPEPAAELPGSLVETPAASFKYTIKNGKCTITGFKGKETKVIIPASIKDAPVTAIDKKAFYNCKKVTFVRIPEGVSVVNSLAFQNCKELERVLVPASVTKIASDAFKGCKNHIFVVDENSWAHNWCDQKGLAYGFSGRVIDAPTAITLNSGEITLGVKEKFTLLPVDDLGNAGGFTFKSSNTSVASVNEDGVIVAKKAGKATITVRAANYVKAECRVVVKAAPKKVSLSSKSMTLYVGESAPIEWKLNSGAWGRVSFSSDSDCASVDENGLVTALAIGEAKITAKTYNGKKASCVVKVVDVPSFVKLDCTELSLPMHMSGKLVPSIDEGCATTYTFTSSDENVAVVDAEGVVTGINAGVATVRVHTHNGHSAECVVEITLAPSNIDLAGEITLGVKEKAALAPVDNLGNTDGFTFKSSKTSVASVSAEGVVTAKKVGKAIITVSTFNGIEAQCTIVVKSAPTSIKFSDAKITLLTGEKHQLAWKLSSKSAGEVSFSSNSDCVKVDENGLVTAVSEGTAKITAKTYNGKKTGCTITVKSSNYAITSMRTDAQHIYATVSTAGACTLHVQVRSEDGKKVLYKASVPAGEKLQMAEIAAAGMEVYPQYYQLRAVLQDDKGAELCNPYISKRYTAAYVEFEQQTPADFDQDRVLDFGGAGFGVLADSVKVITSGALVSGDEYTINTDQEIQPGDVLLINGEPIKVGELLAGGGGGGGGGHARFRRDRNVNVQEVYKSVRVDGYVDLGDAFYNGSKAKLNEISNDEAIVELFKIKKDFPLGKFASITPEFGGTARIRLIYDEINLGKDYFETEFYVEAGGKVELFLGAGFEESDAIELFDIPLPIGATGMAFDLELNIPYKLNAKAGGTATYNFSMKKGVAYTPDMGKQEINEEATPTAEYKIFGEFTASIGIGISGGLTFLDDCLRASLNGELGLQATGVWAPVSTANPMNEAQTYFHACQQCVDITASVYSEFFVALNSRFNKEAEDKEVAHFTIVRGEIPVLEFYFSLQNEVLSVHGGNVKGGMGDCPNNKYRSTVYTVDEYGDDITGIPVTVSRPGMEPLNGVSTWRYYLYPGSYLASGNFDGYPVTGSFTIDHRVGGTTLNAPACSLSGYVKDAYTKEPISGASVSIALPDNKTITVTTDAEGFYNFENLKAGDCSVHFMAKGYPDRHMENLNYKPDTVNQLNVEMLGPMPILKTSLAGPGTSQLLPEDGIFTDGIPEITITNKPHRWGNNYIGDVVLKYEGYKDFVFINSGSCSGTSATCLDMGDGKYTIILSCWINGTMGGSESAVIQVRNGELTIVKQMTLSNNTDGIYAEGKFSSDTKFSGTIYPSKIKFTAKARPTTWAMDNRTGKKIYGRSSGIMNYQKNDEGYYDLVHSISYICGSYNYDHVGTCYTLYKMKNGTLSMEKQWFEGTAD